MAVARYRAGLRRATSAGVAKEPLAVWHRVRRDEPTWAGLLLTFDETSRIIRRTEVDKGACGVH